MKKITLCATIERIRNNTHICLYYLLGGFNVLDSSVNVETQLGIIDYRFEMLYQEIYQKRRRFFAANFSGDLERIIYYLNDDEDVIFNESGMMTNAKLRFMKTDMTRDTAKIHDILQLMENKNYVRANTINITRNSMPETIEAIMPKKGSKTHTTS